MSTNHSEGYSEAANDNNVQKKKQNISIPTFLSSFSKEYVAKKPGNIKNQLIEEVMTQDVLTWTLAEKWLAEFRASYEKYGDIELDKLDVYMLRKYLAKSYLQTQKLREVLKEDILQQYDISESDFSSKVVPPLETLSEKELERFQNSGAELHRFLCAALWVKKVSQRFPYNPLSEVSEDDFRERFSLADEADKVGLTRTLQKLKSGRELRDDEIRALVESPLLEGKEKVDFVHNFIPYITLERAVALWLKTESEAEKIQKQYVDELIADRDLSSDTLKNLKEQINPADINVATKDLAVSWEIATKISEDVGFENFIRDHNTLSRERLAKVREAGPQSFDDMIALIGEMDQRNMYQNLDLFAPGNIVKFTKKQSSDEVDLDYIKIVDFDDEKWEFRFINVWNETLNLDSPGEPISTAYQDFVEGLKADSTTSFEAIAIKTAKERLKSGDIKSSNLQTLTADNFSWPENAERKEQVRQKHIEELESELSELQTKLANSDNKTDKKLLAEIEAKKKEISNIRNASYTDEMAAYSYNRQEFLSKLDELDPEGKKLGFKEWVAFRTGKKMWEGDFWTYTITSIDYESWNVHFTSEAKPETVNLDTFYEVFKEKKANRVASITSPEELLSSHDSFKWHEISNGWIVAKSVDDGTGKIGSQKVEYLSAKKWKIVKVLSFGTKDVELQIGEREDVEKKKLGKNEKSRTNLKIKWAEKITWSLDEFNRYIEENDLSPDWKLGKTITEVPQEHQNKFHGSMTDKFFKWISIYELVAGGKMLIEWVTESLQHGSDIKAAKAALAMWELLPGDLAEDMLSKVEAAESEEMDKALKKLGAVDSWIAVNRIKKWLLNRDTPEHMKEAGMLFMLEKYGHLTAKGWLAPYRGKFLWYEAFGGRIGDELYNEIKSLAENSEPPQTFSEEDLMLKLLKKQCKWYNWIHRRSRLHKEFDGKWKNGIKEELEKWHSDASNYRDVDTIIREALGEAKWGTTSNAIGWMKRIPELGGSLEQMCHVPFTLLTAGVVYDIDQATYKHAKALWDGDGQPIIMLRMFGDKSKMDLFNLTVLELSKEIGNAYPDKYPKIIEDAEELYKNSQNRTKKEADRINFASEFFEKYGTPLSRWLHNSLESWWDTAVTDTIIKRKADQNSTFAKYNELARAAVWEGNSFNKEFVDDAIGETGVFGLNPHDIILKYLIFDQGWGFREKSIAPKIWSKLVDDIDGTPSKVMVPWASVDDPINRQAQKSYIARQLEEIVGAFYEMSGQVDRYIFGLNKETSLVWREFNKWGINLQQDIWAVAAPDIQNGSYRWVFERVADKIISWNGWGIDKSPDVLIKKIKDQAAANMNYDPREWR